MASLNPGSRGHLLAIRAPRALTRGTGALTFQGPGLNLPGSPAGERRGAPAGAGRGCTPLPSRTPCSSQLHFILAGLVLGSWGGGEWQHRAGAEYWKTDLWECVVCVCAHARNYASPGFRSNICDFPIAAYCGPGQIFLGRGLRPVPAP